MNSTASPRGGVGCRGMEQTGRNESEPHRMSIETLKPGDKPSPSSLGEGRREQAGQQSAPVQPSGGVCVDSTSGSETKVSWESCLGGIQAARVAGATARRPQDQEISA